MQSIKIPQPQSIKVNFMMNAILKMSAFVFPLITFPYVSRILGVVGNGKITFASSVVSYFAMFAQLGIPTYGTRVCARCRNNPEKLNRTVQELLIINSVSVFLSYFTLVICMQLIPRLRPDKTLIVISSCTILLNTLGMDWLFSSLEQYSYITMRNLTFKVLAIILMFLFVHKPEDYVVYAAISVLGTCGSNVLNMLYASRFLYHKPAKNYHFKKHIKPVFTFFMLSVSVSVYTNMDSLMLGFMSTDAEVGYYAAATKMKMILVSAVTALGTVLLPRVSNYIAEDKTHEFNRLISKSFNFILDVSIPVTIYFSIMAYAIIRFLAGEGYANAIVPMQVITPTILLISLSNITGMQILVPTNREKWTTLSTVVGAFVNLIVNVITIPALGATGAALGTTIAEASVLAVQVVIVRKELPTFFYGIQISKIVIANVLATLALLLLKSFITTDNYFVDICSTSIVFFGVYGILLLLTKEKLLLNSGVNTLRNIFWKFIKK